MSFCKFSSNLHQIDMAAGSALVSDDSFLCSICLSVFTQPVSIPCGHNFCFKCISDYWDTLHTILQCPLCKEAFNTRPVVRINTVFAEIVEKNKKYVKEKSLIPTKQAGNEDVLCDLCTGSKVTALKSCLGCLLSYCQTHLEPHQRALALKKHKLIDPVKNLESRICQDHGEPLELFCREDQILLCESCKCGDHKTHETFTLEDEADMRKTQLRLENNSMDQMIQEREQKIQEVQRSVKTRRNKAEEVLSYSRKVMTTIEEQIKAGQFQLTEVTEIEQKKTETEAQSFTNELEAEIKQIKKTKLQFYEASLTSDPFNFLVSVLSLTKSKLQVKDWSEVTINNNDFIYQETLAKLERTLRKEIRMLFDQRFEEKLVHAVDDIMDVKQVTQRNQDIFTSEEKVEELKLLKDRVENEVTLPIKTHQNTESINSPVNKNTLKEMYEELRITQWLEIKKLLKSNNQNSECVKDQIQQQFRDATEQMEKNKRLIDEMFDLKEFSSEMAFQKAQEYKQSTIQNLQLAHCHNVKKSDLKSSFPINEAEKIEPVLKEFSSQCYWLGCLLALNNPPLQPDWENHDPGMDPWNIFPRNVSIASGM